ncbi:duf229 domain containing protein [Stylonychia lemnae]|uniref:Duf229 domain containing protein n=1 Tax=Stylonychia lemnae TaxID=5949 RepID=A0A078A4X5_STYLE|nr:duf229 domain containing protein [Stylonychia lemnae]|eukprot:CDW76620.1 duf229 domain containing protein [Stylonychia lemnae]
MNFYGGMYTFAFALLFGLYTAGRVTAYVFKKNKHILTFKVRLVFLFAFVIYLRSWYIEKILNSCSNWTKGLSLELDQSKEFCEFRVPQVCFAEIISDWQDFTRYFKNLQCENVPTFPEIFTEYYKTDKPFIALPLTKNFDYDSRNEYLIKEAVVYNATGYDTLEQAIKDGYEVILDTKNSNFINHIERNETLVEERKKLQPKDRGNLTDNLMLVFIDAFSRQRAHHKLPKTMEFFKERDHKEFFRLHAMHDRTVENMMLFLYGKTREDLSYGPAYPPYDENYLPDFENKLISLIEDFQSLGYITSYAADICETNLFGQKDRYKRFVKNTPADHESVGTTCDPHIYDFVGGKAQFQGFFSIFRHCLYQRDSFVFTFDYAKQFWKTYNQDKKVSIVVLMDGHEETGEVIQYVDEPLNQLLREVEQDNTTIILFSDHGLHIGGIRKIFGGVQRDVEMFNPFIMTQNLKGLKPEYQKNFDYNQQKLITHMEFRNFLKYWASGEYQERSLISKLPNDQENCDFIGFFCQCQNYETNLKSHSLE